MKVLVTGASGSIATAFERASRGGDLELVRTDLEDRDPSSPFAFHHLDVTDPHACVAACQGVDAVVHLAADPSPEADLRTSVLPVNVVGTYNMMEAAVTAGVGRFVFASSGQVVMAYPNDRPVPETASPRPINDYGAGKAFGEALCASFAARSSTSFVAVRLGAFAADGLAPGAPDEQRAAWLSGQDAAHLLARCVLAPLEGYVVVNGISGNAVERLDLTATRALIGYEPLDDGFADVDRASPGCKKPVI